MPETSRDVAVVLLDESSFAIPVKVRERDMRSRRAPLQLLCPVLFVVTVVGHTSLSHVTVLADTFQAVLCLQKYY